MKIKYQLSSGVGDENGYYSEEVVSIFDNLEDALERLPTMDGLIREMKREWEAIGYYGQENYLEDGTYFEYNVYAYEVDEQDDEDTENILDCIDSVHLSFVDLKKMMDKEQEEESK